MVATLLPWTSTARTKQELTSRPSSTTLQAPQLPLLQPSLLPVRRSSSRRTSSRLCRGSHRNSVSLPLRVVWTWTLRGTGSILLGTSGGSAEGTLDKNADEMAAVLSVAAHIANGPGGRTGPL